MRAFAAAVFSVLLGAASHAGAQQPASVRAGYAQALSLFEFLVAARGTGAIACMVDDVAVRGAAFGDALAGEAELSEGDLFGRWRRWAGV